MRLLRKSSAHQMVLGIISTLRRHADIWNAMNLAGEIADVLLDVFVSRKVRIRQVRSLVAEMDRADQIPSGTAEQFAEGMASFARVGLHSTGS